MAFGTGLAILGAAAIGGGASLLAGSKTASAAKDTSAQNNATIERIYGENKAILTPFINPGVMANEAQGRVLNLNGQGGSGSGGQGGAPAGWDYQAFLQQNPQLVQGYNQNKQNPGYNETIQDFALRQFREHPDQYKYTSAPAGFDLQAFLQQNPALIQGYNQNKQNPNYTETLEAFAARQLREQPDVWKYTPPSGTQAPAGPTNPELRSFNDSIGVTPQTQVISNTVGSSLEEFLRNTGQDKSTQALQDAYGGGFQGYMDKSGVSAGESANDALLGVGSGGYDQYQENAGLKPANSAIEAFLGIGKDGLADFLDSTGFKFNLDTGSAAIQRSNAAKGLLSSGATLKDLTTFGQELGRSYGGQYLNALSGYSNLREGQGLNYSGLLGSRTARREGLYGDYAQGLSGLSGLASRQSADFIANQAGLSDLNRSNFGTYWGATGDIANRGLSAGNALAGVGTNVANQLVASNNSALTARAGANANTADTINSLAGNALGAWAYTQKPRPVASGGSSSWAGW